MEGYAHKHNSQLNLLNSYVYAQPFIHWFYICTNILRAYAGINYTTMEQLATSSFWNHLKSSGTASSLTDWQDELEDETLV